MSDCRECSGLGIATVNCPRCKGSGVEPINWQVRAEAAEDKLKNASDKVMEIIAAALSGEQERYLRYDLKGNKYCKWGIVERDILAVFDKGGE